MLTAPGREVAKTKLAPAAPIGFGCTPGDSARSPVGEETSAMTVVDVGTIETSSIRKAVPRTAGVSSTCMSSVEPLSAVTTSRSSAVHDSDSDTADELIHAPVWVLLDSRTCRL